MHQTITGKSTPPKSRLIRHQTLHKHEKTQHWTSILTIEQYMSTHKLIEKESHKSRYLQKIIIILFQRYVLFSLTTIQHAFRVQINIIMTWLTKRWCWCTISELISPKTSIVAINASQSVPSITKIKIPISPKQMSFNCSARKLPLYRLQLFLRNLIICFTNPQIGVTSETS